MRLADKIRHGTRVGHHSEKIQHETVVYIDRFIAVSDARVPLAAEILRGSRVGHGWEAHCCVPPVQPYTPHIAILNPRPHVPNLKPRTLVYLPGK